MDLSAVNSILTAYQSTKTRSSSQVDASSMAAKLTTRLLKRRDSDGDGYLTKSDIGELSSDDFSKLDTDGDGKLSSDEVNTAFKSQLEAIQKTAQTSRSTGFETLSLLKRSSVGKLLEASTRAASSSGTALTGTAVATAMASKTNTTANSSPLDLSV